MDLEDDEHFDDDDEMKKNQTNEYRKLYFQVKRTDHGYEQISIWIEENECRFAMANGTPND